MGFYRWRDFSSRRAGHFPYEHYQEGFVALPGGPIEAREDVEILEFRIRKVGAICYYV